MSNLFFTIANPINIAILRSPLHGLMSKTTMLITVRGHKSGRQIITPVDYHRDGQSITVFSWKTRTWWKNLRGGASVVVRVKGQDMTGTGDVIAVTEEEIVTGLRAMYPRFPQARAVKMAPTVVIVRIQLDQG